MQLDNVCHFEARKWKFKPIVTRIQSNLIFCQLHFFWYLHITLLVCIVCFVYLDDWTLNSLTASKLNARLGTRSITTSEISNTSSTEIPSKAWRCTFRSITWNWVKVILNYTRTDVQSYVSQSLKSLIWSCGTFSFDRDNDFLEGNGIGSGVLWPRSGH